MKENRAKIHQILKQTAFFYRHDAYVGNCHYFTSQPDFTKIMSLKFLFTIYKNVYVLKAIYIFQFMAVSTTLLLQYFKFRNEMQTPKNIAWSRPTRVRQLLCCLFQISITFPKNISFHKNFVLLSFNSWTYFLHS